MFKMVTLTFQRVKGFVFYFPSCSTRFDQRGDVVFINIDIGHPTVAISALSVNRDAVVKKINLIGIF